MDRRDACMPVQPHIGGLTGLVAAALNPRTVSSLPVDLPLDHRFGRLSHRDRIGMAMHDLPRAVFRPKYARDA